MELGLRAGALRDGPPEGFVFVLVSGGGSSALEFG
jgi:glycerate-2-kinase